MVASLLVERICGCQLTKHLNSLPASEVTKQLSSFDLLPDEHELPVDLVEKETNKRTGHTPQ